MSSQGPSCDARTGKHTLIILVECSLSSSLLSARPLPTCLGWYWHVGVFVAIAGALKLGMVLVSLIVLVLGHFEFLIPCS